MHGLDDMPLLFYHLFFVVKFCVFTLAPFDPLIYDLSLRVLTPSVAGLWNRSEE